MADSDKRPQHAPSGGKVRTPESKEDAFFKVGEFVYVTSGKYSSYFCHGVFKVLRDFDYKIERGRWKSSPELAHSRAECDVYQRDVRRPYLDANWAWATGPRDGTPAPQAPPPGPAYLDFTAWLVLKGLAVELISRELYLDDDA